MYKWYREFILRCFLIRHPLSWYSWNLGANFCRQPKLKAFGTQCDQIVDQQLFVFHTNMSGYLMTSINYMYTCVQLNTFSVVLIIVIIIKICSAHISTLLGAQGAETEKTWIQTIYNDSKNNIIHVQCNYKYTCDIRWVLSSDLIKSGFTMTRFEFSWKMIPEYRSRDRKRSTCITPGAQIAWWSVDFKQFRNINWSNVIQRFVNN